MLNRHRRSQQAGARDEALLIRVNLLRASLRDRIGGTAPIEEERAFRRWEDELRERVERSYRAPNRSAFELALKAMHTSLVGYACDLREAGLEWSQGKDVRVSRYLWKYREFLVDMLAWSESSALTPRPGTVEFVRILRSSYVKNVQDCLDHGLIQVFDLYLEHLPFLYRRQCEWVERRAKAPEEDKDVVQIMWDERGAWAGPLAYLDLLMSRLPTWMGELDRGRCLFVLHRWATALLRFAEACKDGDMVNSVAGILRETCDAATHLRQGGSRKP